MTQKPALLFNLGQAHRQADNHKEAAFYFGQYLAQEPEEANRPQVEKLLGQEKELAAAPLVSASPIVVVEERTREVKVPVQDRKSVV